MNSVVLVNEYNQHMQNVPPIRPTAPPMEIIQSIQEEERNIVRENGYLTGEIYLRVTSKKISTKWSKRYFEFIDDVLAMWKPAKNISFKYPCNIIAIEEDRTYLVSDLKEEEIDDMKLYIFSILEFKLNSNYQNTYILGGTDRYGIDELIKDIRSSIN